MVTGASGFVGEAVVFRLLLDNRFTPIAAARGATRFNGLCTVSPFDLVDAEVRTPLSGIDIVVHAAARVHVMSEVGNDALALYRKYNVEGTLRLAKRAAEAGVKRFIFISSIKVNGERTDPGHPFRADDKPLPVDPYGVSKYEAEEGLKQLSCDTEMEVVIIRPPLVYGPGVKANFQSMLNWVNKSVPLPFGAIDNQRSLVSIGNLVDLVLTCIDHAAAANQTFLVSDGQDLSSTQLLKRIAQALGKKSRLMPIPVKVLKLAALILGKQAMAQRLCESLQVDIRKNYEILGWKPPVNIDEAMRETACHYLDKRK